jgi:hypothetical protein
MNAIANSPVALIVGGVILLAIILLGRRIDVKVGNVHAQLTPNGGSTVRDAIDRIEKQANGARARAEDAATQATFAATRAAEALDRIERLEATRPAATAIVVTPPVPETPA